jgi:hypothetical protein
MLAISARSLAAGVLVGGVADAVTIVQRIGRLPESSAGGPYSYRDGKL